jgi:hypothetical protein
MTTILLAMILLITYIFNIETRDILTAKSHNEEIAITVQFTGKLGNWLG